MQSKTLVISVGEPAGIGPEITVKALKKTRFDDIVLVADIDIMRQAADIQQISTNFMEVSEQSIDTRNADNSIVRVVNVQSENKAVPGQLDVKNAAYVLRCIDLCTDLSLSGRAAAMVTAPVHKGIINDSGIAFTGHTERIADRCNSGTPVMMLMSPSMRVCLATTHLPLTKVSEAITSDGLEEVLQIMANDLQRLFGISNPRIAVCGLNPHAGEDGHLGSEEIETIIPLIEKLNRRGFNLFGPIPADTAFTREQLPNFDAFLAMYHDQGLPVVKHSSFGQVVNITLGLPIIRTSVDHGTALDIAGKGMADEGSLIAAIESAREIVTERRVS